MVILLLALSNEKLEKAGDFFNVQLFFFLVEETMFELKTKRKHERTKI